MELVIKEAGQLFISHLSVMDDLCGERGRAGRIFICHLSTRIFRGRVSVGVGGDGALARHGAASEP